MKEELYRKVYVMSEADLPKEDGNYICLHKGATKLDIFPYKVNESHWFVKIDWYLQPIEQSESKTVKDILAEIDKNIERPMVTAQFGDMWRAHAIDHYDFTDVLTIAWKQGRRAILLERALRELLAQQPQKEQEDTYANGYVFCGKCGYKLGKDNPDEEDVEQEIIKALSGEEIEDVKTVTSTEYPVEQSESKTAKTAIKTAEDILEKHLSKENPVPLFTACIEAMEEYRQQPGVTDEEIKKWAFEYVKDVYNNLLPNEGDSMPFDSGDFQLWLNLMVEAAKAMRDNPEQFRDK